MGISKVTLGALQPGNAVHVVRRGTVIDLWRDVDDRGDAEPLAFIVERTDFSNDPKEIVPGTDKRGPSYFITGHLRGRHGTYQIGPFHVSSRARIEVDDTPAPSPAVAGLILDGAKGVATLVVEIRIDGPDGRTYVVSAETEGKAEVKVQQ